MSKNSSLLSSVAAFSFDDLGGNSGLALVAANGEWAWVKPAIYANYAVNGVCFTLDAEDNSDGVIPAVVSEIIEALFTREFAVDYTVEGSFKAAIAAATGLYDLFLSGDYTPFSDVAPSDPEGDDLRALDDATEAMDAARNAAQTEESEEDNRLRLDFSNALIGLDDITVGGSTTADVRKAFDELMGAALDNPHGQDVIREAKEVLEGTQWQLSDDGDRIVERTFSMWWKSANGQGKIEGGSGYAVGTEEKERSAFLEQLLGVCANDDERDVIRAGQIVVEAA